MARLYVGNLDARVTAGELEDEFRVFGVLRSVWVARKPPGFAFIDFDDKRDAEDALRDLDGNARTDGGLSCLATQVAVAAAVVVVVVVVVVVAAAAVVVVVVIGMVALRVSAMSAVKQGTLLVNVACVLVLGVWAVEGVAAGVAAAAPDTAGVRAMVEEVTALVIALQSAAVFRLPVGAAIAGRHRPNVAGMILLMLKGVMVPGIAVAGVRPEACV